MTIPLSLSRRSALGAFAGGLIAGRARAETGQGANLDLGGTTLRVAYYKGGWRPLLQAASEDKTPYKIEWKELNNGVLHIEALSGDALDLGSGSEIPAMFAARQNAKVRFIAVTHEDLNIQVTVAAKDAPIHSIADLKGRRVGYVRATTAHYFLAKQLEEAGLSFGDIDAINLTPSDGYSAFASGQLDAWAIYGYNGQLAIAKQGARLLKTGVGYLSGNFPIYANPKAIGDPLRHAALTDLLLRIQRAYAFANKNFPSYATAQVAETHLPLQDILDQFARRSTDFSLAGVTPDVPVTHQAVADTFLKLGVLDARAEVGKFWNTSFNEAIAKGAAKLATL
ncbi:ABC transporter substrate-binding protein [Bradyrhizobium genosp. P]|uniref:ABC transporter substrate-binding protein n=1 Tax=Bradyrhizobium genosp. P TaxID=83641 RepID=UPI003CF70B49